MKILFISSKDVNAKSNGGELCTNRNYLSFCKLIGKENVTAINLLEVIPSGISNAIKKRINFLFGHYEGLTREIINNIVIQAKNFDHVFIDSSIHGEIAYHLKKNGYKGGVSSFFHNMELNIKLEKAKLKPWKLIEIWVTYHNERLACKYSDAIIAVNERDIEELEKTYKAKNVEIIPISLIDKYDNTNTEKTNVPPTLIFTGNNWYANIHGINWFIDNVLDKVDIQLNITGHKMDELKHKYAHPKINFLGFVDDLAAEMVKADYVLSPIFKGSGMKVKTCEALMFGKHIIGSTESFEGYDIDTNKVGIECNTKEEFIKAINSYCSKERNKFNEDSRNYFLKSYSFDATLRSFKNLINQ